MSWLLAILLAVGAFVLIALVLKAPRKGRVALAAALLLGIAGYGLQASPNLPAAPKAPTQDKANQAAALVEARQALAGRRGPAGNEWIVIGDALARHGQFADAAGVYLGAVEKEPRDAEAWLALANALVGHADGTLTPAALYAFRHAEAAAPGHPGPPFFLGLALGQSGRFEEAREQWADLLAQSPKDAPWRADLEDRLARLDAFIAARNDAGPGR